MLGTSGRHTLHKASHQRCSAMLIYMYSASVGSSPPPLSPSPPSLTRGEHDEVVAFVNLQEAQGVRPEGCTRDGWAGRKCREAWEGAPGAVCRWTDQPARQAAKTARLSPPFPASCAFMTPSKALSRQSTAGSVSLMH